MKKKKTNKLMIFLIVGVLLAIGSAIFLNPEQVQSKELTDMGETKQKEGLGKFITDLLGSFDFKKSKTK